MIVQDQSFIFTIIHYLDGISVKSNINSLAFNVKNNSVSYGSLFMVNSCITDLEKCVVNTFSNNFSKLAERGKGEEFVITFVARDIFTEDASSGATISFLIQEGDYSNINEYISNIVIYNSDNLIYKVRNHAEVKKMLPSISAIWSLFEHFKNNTLSHESITEYLPGLRELHDKMISMEKKLVAKIRLY